MDITKFNQKFNTDADKEVRGVELHIGDDFYVRVARTGNAAAQRMFRELTSDPQFAASRRAGFLSPEKLDEVAIQVFAATILVGWRGLTENGKEIPYSVEKAKELLQMKDFFALVKEFADTQENYRREAVEGAADILGKP